MENIFVFILIHVLTLANIKFIFLIIVNTRRENRFLLIPISNNIVCQKK